MFSNLLLRMRHGTYLRNEHGIKKFAEMAMGQLTRKVTKKSAFYREMNENLLVEKANLRLRGEELYEKAMLDPSDFFSVRRRLWANTTLVVAVLLAAIVLGYIAVLAFIEGDTPLLSVMRWVIAGILAVVLTGGGMIVSERLIEVLLPEGTPRYHRLGDVGKGSALLWGVLLAGILITILGVSEVRASELGAQENSSMVYLGFIVLSVLLPIIAGALRWDAMRFIDVYKTTMAHRQIESRLAQIDSILRQNEEFESNFYKIKSLEHWDQVNTFKTHKDNYNQKKGIVENLSGHFAQTYDTFQAEANKRYSQDIRDITSKSIRKLELVEKDKPVGGKLGQGKGQSKDKLSQQPRPAAAPAESTSTADSSADVNESDVYLSPKPIR